MKSEFVRTLNKLVYNSYCNKTFAVDEPMSEFNSSISKYNVKLKEFVKAKILSIKENDIKSRKALKDIFSAKYLMYPKFLFYWDSSLLGASIVGGIDKIVQYEKI